MRANIAFRSAYQQLSGYNQTQLVGAGAAGERATLGELSLPPGRHEAAAQGTRARAAFPAVAVPKRAPLPGMTSHAPQAWTVDPSDPRAPPEHIWRAMSPDERRAVTGALPSELPVSEAHPPEGDAHFQAKVSARDVLDVYFSRIGRRVYLACELATY